MLGVWKLAALLCFPPGLVGQNAIPPGTILPLSLDTALNAAKAHAGQTIRATVMQDVPGTAIRRRSKVLGHVVEVSGAKGTAARLSFVFDTARAHGHELHFKSNLRAMASVMEVEEAQVPEEMSSRGLTPETWDTQQIGGDEVYRGGGPVAAGLTDVGVPTPWGVLDVPRARRGQPCRGAIDGNARAQAMWLFSSDSCGLYGLSSLHVDAAGRNSPAGTIVLSAADGRLKLGSGTALLLRVF